MGKSRHTVAVEGAAAILDFLIPDRIEEPGLLKTPERILGALVELTSFEPFDFETFDAEGYDEMIVEDRIPFTSLCEHHVLPFFGHVAVGYIPKEKLAGLSKIPRTVAQYAAGLQTQERLTVEIAKRLQEELDPVGLAVVVAARHLCMEFRGAKVHGVTTITSRIEGEFKDAAAKAEFFALITLH